MKRLTTAQRIRFDKEYHIQNSNITMNIPLSVNGFFIGDVSLTVTDSGSGFNIGSLDININQSDPNMQLQMLIDSLGITTPLDTLDPAEIDLVIEKLQEIKLGKV